ncbi:MAG: c-type cytochrome domain-containing protein [Phycisphaeraceae bacterium]
MNPTWTYRALAKGAGGAAMSLALLLWLSFYSQSAIAQDKPGDVSFYKDVVPILKKHCTGCHHPDKAKGKLDLTTFGALQKGGKNGAAFLAGDPDKSLLVKMIKGQPGAAPEMPEDADPLKPEQVAVIEKWIKAGAVDDSPPPLGPKVPAASPLYYRPTPVVDIKWSPDGSMMAITGYHEVILRSPDGEHITARLLGGSPRLESLAFSTDGKWLAVAGGSPAQWGEIQVWMVAEKKLHRSYRIGNDSLFGVSFSPDASLIAFGSADKTARIIKAEDGSEVLFFNNHSDWVFGTTFTLDGKRLLTGSRDMAMKLSEIETKRFIDDVNNPLDTVNDLARHPTQDMVVYGGKLGTVRIYKISDNQNRTAARNDTNLVRMFERQDGPVMSVAYAADGSTIAVGSTMSEVRIYQAGDGKRIAALAGHDGAVYSIAYRPDGKAITTGCSDGKIRIFELPGGKLVKEMFAVPLEDPTSASNQPRAKGSE